MKEVHFKDVQGISAFANRNEWSAWSDPRRITSAEVRQFAELTKNLQWIHTDEARSVRESPYGAVIVHGLFLVSLIPSLLPPEEFRVVGNKVRIIRRIERLRLPSPVFPGEIVRVRARRLKASFASSGKGTIIERHVELWSLIGKRPAVSTILSLQYF